MRLKVVFDGDEYWVELVGGNGKIMMFSESYSSRSKARRAAYSLSRKFNVPVVEEQR